MDSIEDKLRKIAGKTTVQLDLSPIAAQSDLGPASRLRQEISGRPAEPAAGDIKSSDLEGPKDPIQSRLESIAFERFIPPPPAQEPPKTNSLKDAFVAQIKKDLPRDSRQEERADSILVGVTEGIENVVKYIIPLSATGNWSVDFEKASEDARSRLISKLGISDLEPADALFLKAFWFQLPTDYLSRCLSRGVNANVLKKILILDLFYSGIYDKRLDLEMLIKDMPLSNISAYLAHMLPDTTPVHELDNMKLLSTQTNLRKGPIEREMEGRLWAMIEDRRSLLLMGRAKTIGQVKQVVLIDELLNYLKYLKADNISGGIFFNQQTDISSICQNVIKQLQNSLHTISSAKSKYANEERLFKTASLYALIDFDRANVFYKSLIDLFPTNENYRLAHGKFLQSLGRFEDALVAYNDFLSVTKKSSPKILEEKRKILLMLADKKPWHKRFGLKLAATYTNIRKSMVQKAKHRDILFLEKELGEVMKDTRITDAVSPLLENIANSGFDSETFYKIAMCLIKFDNVDVAHKVLIYAHKRESRNQQIIYGLGWTSLYLNKPTDETIKYLGALKKPIFDSERLLGQAYFSQGNDKKEGQAALKKATKHLGVWVERNPADNSSAKKLVQANMYLRNYKVAREQVLQIIQNNPEDGEAYFLAAQLFKDINGQENSTAGFFSRAANCGFDKHNSLVCAAEYYIRAGSFESALTKADEALAMQNNSVNALAQKVYALRSLGKLEDLANNCSLLIQIRPDLQWPRDILNEAQQRLSEAARQQGNLNDVQKRLEDRVRNTASPAQRSDAEAELLGILWQKFTSGKSDQDLQNILGRAESILATYSNNNSALYYYALAKNELGRFDEATSALKKILKHNPNNAATIKLFAEIMLKQGDYESALTSYKKLLGISSSDAGILENVAVIYYTKGEYTLALKYIQDAKRFGRSVNTLKNEANILFALGKLDEAKRIADEVINKGGLVPDSVYLLQARIASKKGEWSPAYDFYDYVAKHSEISGEDVIFFVKAANSTRNFQKSLELLNKVMTADEVDGQLWVLRGDAYFGAGNKEEALNNYNRALELEDNVDVRSRLAKLSYESGKYADVIAMLSGRTLEVKDEFLLELLLKSYILSDKPSEAISLVDRLLPQTANKTLKSLAFEIKGESSSEVSMKIKMFNESINVLPRPELYVKLSRAYADNNKFDDALRACEKAAKLKPGSEDIAGLKRELELEKQKRIFLGRGEEYEKVGNHNAALQAYDDALKLQQDINILLRKAAAEEKAGKIDNAIASLEGAISIDEKNISPRLSLGDIFYRNNNYALAIANYDSALGIDHNNARAIAGKGGALVYSGDSNSAAKFLAGCLEKKQGLGDARVWLFLGLALDQLAKYDKAIEAYDCALRIDKLCETALINKAEDLKQLERHTEAISLYEFALQNNPRAENALIGLSEVYVKLEKYENALEYINRAESLNPQNAVILEQKSNILLRLNRITEAAIVASSLERGA